MSQTYEAYPTGSIEPLGRRCNRVRLRSMTHRANVETGLGCAKTLWQRRRFVMASAMWLSMVILLGLANFRSGIAPK